MPIRWRTLTTAGTEVRQARAIVPLARLGSRRISNSITAAVRIRARVAAFFSSSSASTPSSPATARRQTRQWSSPSTSSQSAGRPSPVPGIQLAVTPQRPQVQLFAVFAGLTVAAAGGRRDPRPPPRPPPRRPAPGRPEGPSPRRCQPAPGAGGCPPGRGRARGSVAGPARPASPPPPRPYRHRPDPAPRGPGRRAPRSGSPGTVPAQSPSSICPPPLWWWARAREEGPDPPGDASFAGYRLGRRRAEALGSPRGAGQHRAAAAGDRADLPGPPLRGPLLGRDVGSLDGRGADLRGPLAEGDRPRPAGARPARDRPRLRGRRAPARRPRRRHGAARRLEAAAPRRPRPGAPRARGGPRRRPVPAAARARLRAAPARPPPHPWARPPRGPPP